MSKLVDRGLAIEPETKEKIIALIRALIPCVRIYFFGSRTTSQFSRSSDIDIAIDAGCEIDILELGELRDVLNATDIPQKIDLVDVYAIPKTLRQKILKDGVEW